MRNPQVVLNTLTSKALDENYEFRRLYRNLYNIEFFFEAYSKIYAKEGNMTQGADGKTIDGMSVKRIENLIEKLKDESYQPTPVKRVYIPKKDEKERPLGIPTVDDKLVQEVIRSILESIFEPQFSRHSHAFRPNKSCHTALTEIRNEFTATRWFIEGDIKGFFDNINHHILINILKKTIDDQKFLRLIWKFLRAGYVENWKYHKTYSGTPQGGILSPLLSNIYLNELDKYIENYIKEFNSGKTRAPNGEYRRLDYKIKRTKTFHTKNWKVYDVAEKIKATKEVKKLIKELRKLPSVNLMDDNYKRMSYTRYADDFIIGVIGTKADAQNIKQDLTSFLKQRLNLELSQEKTLITNSRNFAEFLGYNIATARREYINTFLKKGKKVKVRQSMQIVLYVPKDKWVNKLIDLGALKIKKDNTWKAIHRPYLINLDDLEILNIYNAELRGMYNYYRLANNASVFNNFHFIMENSMKNTFANKYKTSANKIWKKYNINGRFGIKYKTKKGEKVMFFNERTYPRQSSVKNYNMDLIFNTQIYKGRTSLVERMLAEKCEYCGRSNLPIEIHHVRKLKDLKGKKKWERLMIERRRKTLALCHKCHVDLHAGRLD